VALLDDGTTPPTGQHHEGPAAAAPNGHGVGVPTGHAVPRGQV
jgi:hypothetical protein